MSIRCAWRHGGDDACQDEAELIVGGRGLCEAHALHLDHDRRAREKAEWKAFEDCIEWMRRRDEILWAQLRRDEVAPDSLKEQRPSWWLQILKRFTRADVKPKA